MGKKRSRNRQLGFGIAAVGLVLLAVAAFAGWQAVRGYRHKYCWESYAPLRLSREDIGQYPAAHPVDDGP